MKVCWLSPGDPAQNTGGYRYNARIIEQLQNRGIQVDLLPLPGRWPLPLPGTFDVLSTLLSAIPDDRIVIADGLCWPGLEKLGAALTRRCKVVVIVHSLLARETVLDPDESTALLAIEVASWHGVRMLIATSRKTANEIAARLSAPTFISIPGTDPVPRAPSSSRGSALPIPRRAVLLTIGSLVPRKGHDLLLRALAAVRIPWELRCIGGARDLSWAKRLKDLAEELHVGEHVSWLGDLPFSEVSSEIERADLVLQTARYESFGMAIAEAVARGRPVLTAPAGVTDHLPDGAVQVIDGEAATWSAAIEWFLTDTSAQRVLGERAMAARSALPTWEKQADGWVTLLESL